MNIENFIQVEKQASQQDRQSMPVWGNCVSIVALAKITEYVQNSF